ncbi:angiopoietin-4-like, partial [Saccostrea echinata]|uniref:angiopoietin-4-like n=1 Tax=Saccostrea echinata TaxID=191078 RepID=UPI002A82A089
MTTDGGVILRRIDGSVDFYRSWDSYKDGFWNVNGEYWLGNKAIHILLTNEKQELSVDLQNFSGKKAFAKYSSFLVGNESQKFKLTVSGYSGTAGDSLALHNDRAFSTKDEDNDTWSKSCAVLVKGGWWFKQCNFRKFEALLKLTPWNWKHLNTSVKVDTPVSVDISLLSYYNRLTGRHFSKYKKFQKYRECASIVKFIPNTKGKDGVYTIYPDMKTKKVVYCDMTTDVGGWAVIQRRINGSVDFYRSWKSYQDGFGNVYSEYWLGNEAIHILTTKKKQELRINVQNFSGSKAFAKYSSFSIGNESQKYNLTLDGYSGTAGDSFGQHSGGLFSTKAQDNDSWGKSCAVVYKGGWWFKSCLNCDLNRPYHRSAVQKWASVVWYQFGNENRSLRNKRMMIRLKSNL